MDIAEIEELELLACMSMRQTEKAMRALQTLRRDGYKDAITAFHPLLLMSFDKSLTALAAYNEVAPGTEKEWSDDRIKSLKALLLLLQLAISAGEEKNG